MFELIAAGVAIGASYFQANQQRREQDKLAKRQALASAVSTAQTGTLLKNLAVGLTIAALVSATIKLIVKD